MNLLLSVTGADPSRGVHPFAYGFIAVGAVMGAVTLFGVGYALWSELRDWWIRTFTARYALYLNDNTEPMQDMLLAEEVSTSLEAMGYEPNRHSARYAKDVYAEWKHKRDGSTILVE